MKPTYTYEATLIRVIDGDSVVVHVDLGFYIHMTIKLRLLWINAPEVVGEQRAAGLEAKKYLESIIPERFTIRTFKDPGDKYGRWLAEIYNGEGESLNMQMVEAGHAVFAPKSLKDKTYET